MVRKKSKHGGWNPFHNGYTKDGVKYGPWYNPSITVLNKKKIYKEGAIKALKSAIRPTINETKKILWNKQTKKAGKKVAQQALLNIKKNLLTKKNIATMKRGTKRAIKTSVNKSLKSFVHNKKIQKTTANIFSAWAAEKIGEALMGKVHGGIVDQVSPF